MSNRKTPKKAARARARSARSPNQPVADAIREVAASVQKAVAEGYRSRMIDADDLIEALLAIADRLDPPLS